MQEHHAVRHVAREAHLVRDDQHRAAFLRQRAHHAQHFADQLRIERRGRLVEQHHLRLHRQGAGDRHALLLAARQMRRIVVALLGDADLGEQRLGLLDAFGAGRFCTCIGASIRFSSTVMCDHRLKFWNTMPSSERMRSTWRRSAGWRLPSRAPAHLDRLAGDRDAPSSGVSSRLMQRRNVLLPEPLRRGSRSRRPRARQRDAFQHLEVAEALVHVHRR